MFFPVFLPIIVGFLGFVAYKRHVHTNRQSTVNENFLTREVQANSTRRKDISTLNYLPFSLEKLPAASSEDEELNTCEEILRALADQRIINLSGISNTELKKMYGPANLTDLSQYDENFILLEQTLLRYSLRKEALGCTDEAVQILEYAVTLKADLADIYLKLAELWNSLGETDKIHSLAKQLASDEDPVFQRISERLKSFC